ncbi:hypothetical protein V6N13_074206 [Hibiscus sabdariffa]|uniref:Uncharacterized protein n=1 Tax=Hibiscus sabdariffa TaxID=183260 RepID=A0ABR2U828_9ROSI
MLISSKDKEPLRESTNSDEAGLCITRDVGSIDSNQITLLVEPIKENSNLDVNQIVRLPNETSFGIDQLSELYALQDRLEEFDYKLEDVQSGNLS